MHFEMENVTTVSQQNFYVNRFIVISKITLDRAKGYFTTVYFDI